MDITKKIAADLGISPGSAASAIKLIDEGCTVPFIARYRKEATGGMTDVTLRELEKKLAYLRSLEDRKEEIISLINEQGKLTEELEAEIRKADVLQRVEDLYRPFKKKRATRGQKAREKGFEPLAEIILSQNEKTGSPEDLAAPFGEPKEALAGACDIIAEDLSDDADLRERLRGTIERTGRLVTEAADPEAESVYSSYYDSEESLSKIPDHRVLAVNRGEKEGFLKVKIVQDDERLLEKTERKLIRKSSIFEDILSETAADALKRLLVPSLHREIRSRLTEKAEADAAKLFAENTEKLLMVQPVRGARIISIDPGFRTGCKVAVLDETGKLLDHTTIYPTEPRKDIKGTKKCLDGFCRKYRINTIVIGNGTASRETEEVVADFIRESSFDLRYTIVNEAGASVYSASELAAEEYPDLDVTTRGAMSLGRRLQDPLAELVKIPVRSIGVGQYQHDIDKKMLEKELSDVVENCVNRVGVDLNTASVSLLSYVSGITGSVAKNIVRYREENGRFKNRKQLMKVPGLGPKAFSQCAGFLRISGGSEPLDSTAVHPESYELARRILKETGTDPSQIGDASAGLDEKLKKISARRLAEKLDAGAPTVTDILDEIRKPGRDPRENAPEVIFRSDVRSLSDLEAGMKLKGTVRNVVDFGAFVDIGVKQDGLVHISQMSDRYVKHPTDVVSVGDTVDVRIIDIDEKKGRISLSMKHDK